MERPSNYFGHEEEEALELPPGFRFHPTDEELVTHYLSPKLLDDGFRAQAIGEVDLNKCEPWELPGRAKIGGKEWYFFYLRDRKYPTGLRTNRATNAGYWKATGKDKEIHRKKTLVGMKKTLVFYKGRASRGLRTDWIMHEYRLEGNQLSLLNLTQTPNKDEWVICRIFDKSVNRKRTTDVPGSQTRLTTLESSPHSCAETGLTELVATGATTASHVTCFSDNLTKQENESDMSHFIDSNNNLENLQISEHDDEISVLRMFIQNYGLNSASTSLYSTRLYKLLKPETCTHRY